MFKALSNVLDGATKKESPEPRPTDEPKNADGSTEKVRRRRPTIMHTSHFALMSFISRDRRRRAKDRRRHAAENDVSTRCTVVYLITYDAENTDNLASSDAMANRTRRG